MPLPLHSHALVKRKKEGEGDEGGEEKGRLGLSLTKS